MVRRPVAQRRGGRGAGGQGLTVTDGVAAADLDAVGRQLGREARGVRRVAHRCPCGSPDVVETAPRLPGRHAVPDALLPDLPEGGRGDRHARGRRHHAGDDRAARLGPRPGRGLPGGARALPRRPRGGRGGAGDRRRDRGRHAGPGQVPARAGRARPGRGAGRQPARRRGPGRPARVVAQRVVRRAGRTRDPGRRRRLRHQLDPAAGRRRRPGRPARSPRSTGGWRSCGSARASTAPARSSPAALARTFAACDAYAEAIRSTGAERVRFVATSASRDVDNRDEFVAGVRSQAGRRPRGRHRRRGGPAVLRRRDARAPRRRRTRARSWSSTSAAARPSSCSATPTWRPPGRSTSAACG